SIARRVALRVAEAFCSVAVQDAAAGYPRGVAEAERARPGGDSLEDDFGDHADDGRSRWAIERNGHYPAAEARLRAAPVQASRLRSRGKDDRWVIREADRSAQGGEHSLDRHVHPPREPHPRNPGPLRRRERDKDFLKRQRGGRRRQHAWAKANA